jgi:NAD(P)-dependent dehydrogenase (short-subunit alcohol dehydrogenase family)
MSLLGKTVVLTGAATESGADISRELLHNGAAAVGLLDWHGVRLDALAELLAEEFGEERVVPLPTNLSDRTQVRHSLREFSRITGRIDVLVENTGALVNRGLAHLRARGIASHDTGNWHRELLATSAGVGRNLRTALHELRVSTPSPIVTVTPAAAEAVQYLVSAVSGPLN